MVVRITRGRFDPARIDDVQRVVDEELIPALRRFPGFLDYKGGVNRRTGQVVAITSWDTAEHANFARDAISEMVAALSALGVTLEPADIYEITAQS
jgi:hypothetical protein